jgi:hypothetical protein
MRRGVVPFPSGIHQWTQFDSVFISVLDGISLGVFYCEQCQKKGNKFSSSLDDTNGLYLSVCCIVNWEREQFPLPLEYNNKHKLLVF